MDTPSCMHNVHDKPVVNRRNLSSRRRGKTIVALFAFLSGGSLMGGCETRFKEAAMDTTRQFVLGLLDPVTIAELILGEDLVDSDQ